MKEEFCVHVILLSGGTGSRMQQTSPKQFLNVRGKPLLQWSLEKFLSWNSCVSLTLVSHKDHIPMCKTILEASLIKSSAYNRTPSTQVVAGGATRHESTLCGIHALKKILPQDQNNNFIFIHDGARATLQTDELERLLTLFLDSSVNVASLASPIYETVFFAESLPGKVTKGADREHLFSIKTPQALRSKILDELLQATSANFTDLLTWAKSVGIDSHLVEASQKNIKLTTQEDLPLLEFYLKEMNG